MIIFSAFYYEWGYDKGMQRDTRGTMAFLGPQIGSQRPSSNLSFAGERPDDGPACERRGARGSPANPKLLDGLGEPIWGVREATVPLLSFCIPLLSLDHSPIGLYHPPIIPFLFS